MKKDTTIKPLFKYIGGKSWLKTELRAIVEEIIRNTQIKTYTEPFVGGLGSFLNVYDILLKNNIKNVFLSDINETLISTYKAIKENPQDLIKEFLIIENSFVKTINPDWKKNNKADLKIILKPAETFFNAVKKEFNQNKNKPDIKQSARLVFLQKHSFNGIYRENSKGEYNTPFNWSGSNMLQEIETKVNEISILLNKFNIEFTTQSFEKINYNKNTLYYLDPPYLNENKNENKYQKESFGIEKQLLLINNIKNTTFIYSNHKTEKLLDEFKKIKNIQIHECNRKNIMSSNKETRKDDKTEILVYHINKQ